MLVLIALSVTSFVFGTLFDPDYSRNDYAGIHGVCGSLCYGLLFGNYSQNFLHFLGIGPTSVLEIWTVLIFTVDYVLRVCVADLENSQYSGILGRLRYIPTFYSLIDLISIVSFYVDSFLLVNSNLAASQFVRMFRIFRMMKGEGRACADFDTSQCTFDIWGFVDCPDCSSTPTVPFPCYNMYQSILSALVSLLVASLGSL